MKCIKITVQKNDEVIKDIFKTTLINCIKEVEVNEKSTAVS
ncbi:MAG: hypothetical protein ACRC51_07985 [Cetobacterium sp.]